VEPVNEATSQNPFNAKLVVGLIVASLLAFAALVLLLAFGSRIGPIHDSRAPALSVSATGFKGLVSLVGHFRETREISGTEDLETDDLVIVALDPRNRAEDVQRLLDLRGDRATLIILPKWVTMPDPNHRAWVRALGPGAGPAGAELIGGKAEVHVAAGAAPAGQYAAGRDFLDGLRVPIPESAQTIAGSEDLTPLVTLPNGGALIARLGVQPHYVAADPDLFDNHGLRDPAQARAALELIEALGSRAGAPVAFDLTVYGLADDNSPSLLRTLLEPPFLAMTLALLVAALLAGLHGAFRFGQARREERAIAFGKAALVENSAGLIRIARRETRLGGAYADLVRQDAARIAAAPATLQSEALDAYLDKLGRGDGPPFSALAARLAAARDRNELVAAARALFSWKKDIIR
jgi:hypothetical protein